MDRTTLQVAFSMTTNARNKKKQGELEADAARLYERVLEAGCARLAIVSLHPGAGAVSVVETLAGELAENGTHVGVTGVPRIESDGTAEEQVKGIRLPAETLVATASSVVPESGTLERLVTLNCRPPLGELAVDAFLSSDNRPRFYLGLGLANEHMGNYRSAFDYFIKVVEGDGPGAQGVRATEHLAKPEYAAFQNEN